MLEVKYPGQGEQLGGKVKCSAFLAILGFLGLWHKRVPWPQLNRGWRNHQNPTFTCPKSIILVHPAHQQNNL